MRVDYHQSFVAMNTRFEIILRGEDEQHLEAVAVMVSEEIQRLDATLSRFNPSSEIARLNRHANTNAVKVDREIFALLAQCECARKNTQGFFDIAAATGGAGIELNVENCAIRFTDAATQIDLGAIGKGYALDCGVAILARFGIESALLNGGNSSVRGLGSDEWMINVQHPLYSETIVQQQLLSQRALSCSAARHASQVESDIRNPLAGLPIAGNDACVVLADTATEAEIYSTAFLAMGRRAAIQYLGNLACNELQVEWF